MYIEATGTTEEIREAYNVLYPRYGLQGGRALGHAGACAGGRKYLPDRGTGGGALCGAPCEQQLTDGFANDEPGRAMSNPTWRGQN
ncbi:MAG: hypothetical protein U0903_19895 [Planctomycetales bacterium]